MASAARGPAPAVTSHVQPTIQSVGVVTRGRPVALARALESYADNLCRFGRAARFAVFDGATTPLARHDCRAVVERFAATRSGPAVYVGREQTEQFIDRLCREAAIPREVVTFALVPDIPGTRAYGANRNAALLHSAGHMLLSVDDDTVCRTAAAGRSTGLDVTVGRDPGEYWFFLDRETTCRRVAVENVDLLAAHEQLLGREVGAIVGSNGDIASTVGAPPAAARLSSPTTTVGVTFGGIYGDCGWGAPFGWWGTPTGYLMLDDASHARLTRSLAGYRVACTSREILRRVPRCTISDPCFSMTTVVGLDNRDLLPPFPPVQRGEDIVFGHLFWRCFTNRCLGHVPVAVLHDPPPRRFSPGEVSRSASGFDTAKLMLACLHRVNALNSGTDPAAALVNLGGLLEGLAGRSPAEFARCVQAAVADINRQFEEEIRSHLRRHSDGAPYWADDLKSYLSLLRQSARRDDYVTPLDLLSRRTVDEACALGQELVGRFGRLLQWWPRIVEASRHLGFAGERLDTGRGVPQPIGR